MYFDTRLFADLLIGRRRSDFTWSDAIYRASLTPDAFSAYFSRFAPDTAIQFNPADEGEKEALYQMMDWGAALLEGKLSFDWFDYFDFAQYKFAHLKSTQDK